MNRKKKGYKGSHIREEGVVGHKRRGEDEKRRGVEKGFELGVS